MGVILGSHRTYHPVGGGGPCGVPNPGPQSTSLCTYPQILRLSFGATVTASTSTGRQQPPPIKIEIPPRTPEEKMVSSRTRPKPDRALGVPSDANRPSRTSFRGGNSCQLCDCLDVDHEGARTTTGISFQGEDVRNQYIGVGVGLSKHCTDVLAGVFEGGRLVKTNVNNGLHTKLELGERL